ncbi:probable metal-nicotianamine transporter YSL8 [Impatiens glandulifera]|uniref:probable metal-nicotianamine transporter YSL8 n=1 Tax=Impatiens glandulifera TaxID=253017 RepID=UPI001FB0A507|nr:probable metal-nicotianamine transporter YSL8 [Impatiens glandulifera]
MERSSGLSNDQQPYYYNAGGDEENRRSGGAEELNAAAAPAEDSVESVNELVSTWKQHLTVRAFVVAFLLGVLFTFIVMKLSLTTGIIPTMTVPAGLLGFFFVKTWTKLLQKAGLLQQPFTRQENTVIQTCVVATSGIAFSGIYIFI